MEKINFQNGKTPLNDTNLNKMQSNIEESCVIVSSTQPTTNEKVWMQKSNNLIKLDDSTITENGITFSVKDQILHITGTATEYTQAFYIPFNDRKIVEPETLTAYFTGSGAIIKASYSYEGTVYYPNLDILKLPIGAVLYQVYFIIEKGTTVDMTVKLQLEKGDKSTEWKQAVDDGILTRNTNGNYEKLTLEKYSTGEQVIGTWIDGKPIYRKVFTGTSSTQENAVIQNYVGNVDTVVHAYGQLENSAGMKIALLSDTQSNVWDSNNFTVYVNNASSDTYKYKLIYEYTKSTD